VPSLDGVWSSLDDGATAPNSRREYAAIFDQQRDRYLIFGGSWWDAPGPGGLLNEIRTLTLGTHPTWSQLQIAGPTPGERHSPQWGYDPARQRLLIFGGWDSSTNDTTAFLGDVWALTLAPGLRWTQLAPGGQPLPHRDTMAAVYDPSFDRMVVFGGWSGGYMLGDTQFLTWGQTAPAPALAPSAQADPATAQIQWGAQNVIGDLAAIYRCEPGTPWSSIATVDHDGSGTLAFQDSAVLPGMRYGYQLVVPSQQGAVPGGEVWVDVPTNTTGVPPSPTTGLAFALDRVEPNPVVDRFVVSFVLASAARAGLDVFDITGQRRLSREVGSLGAGAHPIDLGRARDFPPGMYFVRLSQSGQVSTRRFVIGGRPAVAR
jgi:hypothetical protein